MELDVAIVMIAGLVFISLLGVHAFRYYAGHNASSLRLAMAQEHAAALQNKDLQIEKLANAAHNWKNRHNALKRGYSIDPEDDYLEEEIDPENEEKLSDFAKHIYPKLPRAISDIIDDESFQGAIVNTAKKNSSGIASLIEKFVKPADQGSNSNTPKSKQVYV